MNKRKTNTTQKIIMTEVILILGILTYLFFSTAPSQVYPLNGMVIMENNFIFEIENGKEIVISTDENFTNPFILIEGSDIILPPGEYFWKVKGKIRESRIQNFTIKEYVALNLKEKNKSYEIKNTGNIDLNLTRKRDGIITSMAFKIGQSEEVEKDNSGYEGRQI